MKTSSELYIIVVSFPEQTETLKTAECLKIMGITLTLNLFHLLLNVLA